MNQDCDWMEIDFCDSDAFFTPSRRDFLKTLGGGLIVFFFVGDDAEAQRSGRRRGLPDDFNAFLQIGEDGRVTCTTGKIEMGQGIITSLAQMLADELDVPLDTVDMVMGDTDLCPYDRGTHGSQSTRFFGPPLRAAAAQARSLLLEMAAEHLKVPRSQLKTENGAVIDTAKSQNRVAYTELTRGKKIARQLKEEAVQKSSAQYKVMGKPILRADSEAKVTGKAQYAADIQLPDMLYARVLRPPAHGAKLLSVDIAEAEAMDGVSGTSKIER